MEPFAITHELVHHNTQPPPDKMQRPSLTHTCYTKLTHTPFELSWEPFNMSRWDCELVTECAQLNAWLVVVYMRLPSNIDDEVPVETIKHNVPILRLQLTLLPLLAPFCFLVCGSNQWIMISAHRYVCLFHDVGCYAWDFVVWGMHRQSTLA